MTLYWIHNNKYDVIYCLCLPFLLFNTLFLCLYSLQRFFVLDNGILKYSKTPIDVSNPDYYPWAGQPGLTSARQWVCRNICNTVTMFTVFSENHVTLHVMYNFTDRMKIQHTTEETKASHKLLFDFIYNVLVFRNPWTFFLPLFPVYLLKLSNKGENSKEKILNPCPNERHPWIFGSTNNITQP